MKSATRKLVVLAAVLAGLFSSYLLAPSVADAQEKATGPTASPVVRSPNSLAVTPDGATLYVADQTSQSVAVIDLAKKTKRAEIRVEGEPRDLCLSADGRTLYVAERGAGSVALIDTAKGVVTGRIVVGRWPIALALARKANRLFVGNQDRHTVSVVDLGQPPGKVMKEIAVVREPSSIVVTPDERFAVVTNLLPYGVGTDPTLAAVVSIINLSQLRQVATVKLPPGSTNVRSVCTSPDGRRAYVVHGLGRFNLPITQLERGWVNTYALSVIDVEKARRTVTVLLDDLTQGAADPYCVVCSSDGGRLWISHAGVHEVSMINIRLVHELLAGKVPEALASLKDGSQDNIWVRIAKDPSVIRELENDLTALYIAGAISRAPSGGTGPRAIALSSDDKTLFVANYYSGNIGVLDAASGRSLGTVSLGPQAKPDAARRGEIIFHDATMSFQRWHSCGTCHPNGGRVDGLRWDFLGDGIGNAKDTLNLVFVHKTEPLNRRATRKTAREGARTGLLNSHMIVPTDEQVEDLLAFLVSLRPDPSPFLTADGKLSKAAMQGKLLFEGKADCARCHPAPYFTDRKMHNVGVLSSNEPDGRYDTPSLIEAHRTGPYLHDGRAMTINDVLTAHDRKRFHGKLKGFSRAELDALIAYVRSL